MMQLPDRATRAEILKNFRCGLSAAPVRAACRRERQCAVSLSAMLRHQYVSHAQLQEWLRSHGLRDYFHPGVVVRVSSIAGRGLFAAVAIRAGELISYEDPGDYLILNRAAIESLPAEDQDFWWHFCYQVGDDAWMGPKSREVVTRKLTFFENHSCDPSTWFVDDITMTARRDIAPSEEITYDYSTTESYIDPEMETVVCRCGAPCCRGRMHGDDWQRPELQAAYGEHWIGYLRDKIHRMRQESGDSDSLSAVSSSDDEVSIASSPMRDFDATC